MPRRDATGPMGYGPMTGRGMGNCRPNASSAYGYGMGMGFGRRCGFGRGFGWSMGYGVAPNLETRKRMLEDELRDINSLLSKESEN